MNITLENKIKASLAVAFLLFAVGFLAVTLRKEDSAFAGVNIANDYQSTTTPQAADLTVLCTGPGAVGDVNIEGVITGNIDLLDATTSNVTLRTWNPTMPSATSSLYVASIPRGTGTSTRPINAFFRAGLLLDTNTSVATATISYRCYQ